jgi:isochorismate synthase
VKELLLYRFPGATEVKAFEGKWRRITEADLLTTKKGFIFCDYKKENIFHFTSESIAPNKITTADFYHSKNKPKFTLSKKDYLSKCNDFITACKDERLVKIVLSRTIEAILPSHFDLAKFFRELCISYTHSFNYLVSIPDIGTWVGATPEQLLVKDKQYYTTVSLAGTRTIHSTEPFTEKEFKEQHLVTEYIEQILKQHNCSYWRNELPEITRAGNLLHLKTLFNKIATSNPIALATHLHPTPAVCGLPVEKSQQFIVQHEGYNRDFYSGFLGVIDEEDFALYVNLRCAEIIDNRMCLYIGGGITAQSNPESEWEETENKSQTLLTILKQTLN